MSEDVRARCCEPFFTTKGARSSGLGLAMVHGMLERHGGSIQVESILGVGTAIQLIFPSLSIASTEPTDEVSVPQIAQALRVLYIDDDPIITEWFSNALGKEGHDVLVAGGGRRGIEAFHEAQLRGRHFDVVITDLKMPDIDGREVAAAVKAASASMPVILLTGSGDRMLGANEVPTNVNRVLSKPPKLTEILQALGELAKDKTHALTSDL
jgi:CheY-like chemotaxis protein